MSGAATSVNGMRLPVSAATKKLDTGSPGPGMSAGMVGATASITFMSSASCAVAFVALRGRSTRNASRSCSTSRSVASSRLRHWLRSSCATARSTEPARAITRLFCRSVRAVEASTSNAASTRGSVFWAC